jgi:chromosome segregation ATPase
MRQIPDAAREHADLALAVYVEELAARRRVLFVGDAASAVPERLSSVARSVEVVSPRTRARGTRRGGRILPRPWPSAQDAKSWDLVLVPDLLWAGPPSPERVAEMAEWLTPRGVLVVGAEEREEAIAYEALYDLLARRFEQVKMLGQAPFAGWAVVDFAPSGAPAGSRELDVTFDGSLLGGTGEEPARYLAVCAAREVVLDAYAIIQVPSSSSPPPREARAPERAPGDAQLQTRMSQLEVQLRDRQDELDRSRSQGESLERELTAVRARVEHAERRLEQAQREIAKSSQRYDEARSKVEALGRELEGARAEVQALERAAGERVDEEYERLETALSERGKEINELRIEVERRGVLARDLVEELRELRGRPSPGAAPSGGGGGPAEPEGSRSQLEAALEGARRRAVAAEAAVAEAGFKADELRGELALCRKQREAEREQIARALQESENATRDLQARMAETEELRRLSEARLALTLDDLATAHTRLRDLERELEEARDRVRASFVRPPADEPAPDIVAALQGKIDAIVAEASEREGRLYGALLAARESTQDLQAERKRLHRDLAKAQETRAAEAPSDVASLRRAADELRGERDGLRLRLADAEAALEARPAGPANVELEQRALVLSQAAAMWTQRASEAAARAEEEAKRVAELSVRLSTRDAMIGRVQSEVSDSIARREGVERRVKELEGTIHQLREQLDGAKAVADVRSDEGARETREIERRLAEVEKARDRAEQEHEETRRALAEARQILAAVASGLESGAPAAPPPASDARLRERMESMQREASDRELMLRSLTAQLQDRDDRIRALERMRAGEGKGDEADLRQRVLLAEERSVRLERELEQERTARRLAESGTSSPDRDSEARSRDAELRRLNQLLGDRDASLMVLEGRVTASERESKTMKDAFAQARAGLETLLGDIANDQRAEAADRIASMLRLLRRF